MPKIVGNTETVTTLAKIGEAVVELVKETGLLRAKRRRSAKAKRKAKPRTPRVRKPRAPSTANGGAATDDAPALP